MRTSFRLPRLLQRRRGTLFQLRREPVTQRAHSPNTSRGCEVHWTLAELVGYTRSWSATGRFIEAHGYDPTTELEKELRAPWGSAGRRQRVWWPFVVRAGCEA
jgi:hypothetical protein